MAYTDFNVRDASQTVRTFLHDYVGSRFFQRFKILWGAEGTVNEVSYSTPLPTNVLDNSGQLITPVEASPDNAAYVCPAVSISSNGGKLSFDASVASGALTGTLVVLCSTQPCYIRQGTGTLVAVVDSDTYLPANTRSPFIITAGNKIAAVKPTGGVAGDLNYSIIG